MKSSIKKILALLLAAVMVLPAVSCAKTEESESTTAGTSSAVTGEQTETESETDFMPDIEKKNYESELAVLSPNNFLMDYCFPAQGEEDEANSLNEVLVERAVKIKEHIGTELVLLEKADWVAYSSQIIRTVQAHDDAYQMVLTHPYQGIPAMISANCLYDFKDLPSVNLDAPYWSESVMESTRIGEHNYLGYNDFMLSEVHVVSFNKEMLEEQQLGNPYELVRNKEWTLDKFIGMTKGISQDVNGDGVMDKNDKYGVCGWGWVPLIDFITASDIQMVIRDPDTDAYVVAYDEKKERVINVIDQVFDMYNADSSYFWKSVQHPLEDFVLKMESGRSLFSLISTAELLEFRDVEVRLGVLPYPLYDKNQEDYHSLIWNGQMCIPSSIKNPEMVSDAIELLAAYAAPVKTAFYEKLLGLKLSEAPDDSEMLDIVWKSQISDCGMTLCNLTGMNNILYIIPFMCENEGQNNYASYMKTTLRAANHALDKFLEKVNKNG